MNRITKKTVNSISYSFSGERWNWIPPCITTSKKSFQMITLFQRALLFKVMAAGDSIRPPRIGGFITSRKEHAL
jgi:hypothetical protein